MFHLDCRHSGKSLIRKHSSVNEFRDDEDETASDKSRLIHMKRFGHWLSQNV